MNILIRSLQKEDLNIYKTCYSNSEFKHFIYGDKNIEIEDLFIRLLENANSHQESYVVFYNNDGLITTYNPVGFCNFLKYDYYPFEISKETFAINGGLQPILFNSGLGIFSCASLLHFFFLNHPNSDLYASAFEDNLRSAKMLCAFGFKQMEQTWYNKKHFILNHERFSNCKFSSNILSRITLVIET